MLQVLCTPDDVGRNVLQYEAVLDSKSSSRREHCASIQDTFETMATMGFGVLVDDGRGGQKFRRFHLASMAPAVRDRLRRLKVPLHGFTYTWVPVEREVSHGRIQMVSVCLGGMHRLKVHTCITSRDRLHAVCTVT